MGVSPKIRRLTIYGGKLTGMMYTNRWYNEIFIFYLHCLVNGLSS